MNIILVNIISIISQTFANSYLILTIRDSITKEKLSKSKLILFVIGIALILIIATLIKYHIPGINTLFILLSNSILIMLLLNIKLFKSILITIILFAFSALTEIISVYITMFIFSKSMTEIISSGKYLMIGSFFQLLFNMLIILFYKKIYTKKLFLTTKLSNKQVLLLIAIIAAYIFPQMLIFVINSYTYPISLLVINSVQFVLIFFIAFKFVKSIVDYERTQSELFTAELHNKTLNGLLDGLRIQKHDHANMVQTLNGYVSLKEYDKLEEYVLKLMKECNAVDDLSLVNPEIFNEPAIYGIVGSKYFQANKKGIPFKIKVETKVPEICFPKPELSRILGILLDNAIEATSKTDKPFISLKFYYDKRKCADVIKVTNTYDTSVSINTSDVFKKGFSTKEVPSGIGLYEVKELINKRRNSQIYANIIKNKFTQTIIIEKNEEYSYDETQNIKELILERGC